MFSCRYLIQVTFCVFLLSFWVSNFVFFKRLKSFRQPFSQIFNAGNWTVLCHHAMSPLTVRVCDFKPGFLKRLESFKKSWSVFSNFPDLENGDKVWKKVKRRVFFLKLQQVLYKWNVFSFGQIFYSILPVRLQRITKKTLFLSFLRSLLITYLIKNY